MELVKYIEKNPTIQGQVEELLKTKQFDLIQVAAELTLQDNAINDCDPESVLKALMRCAMLNLSPNKAIGECYIIPYKKKAEFQLGYKGLINLVLRSNRIKKLSATELYRGQLVSYNPITEEYTLSDKFDTNEVSHYAAYFKLDNGFEKTIILSKESIKKHALQYVPSLSNPSSPWQRSFDSMAKKTVLIKLLKPFAPKEIMQVIQEDQNNDPEQSPIEDLETEEIKNNFRGLLSNCQNKDELKDLWESVEEKDKEPLKELFSERKKLLNKKEHEQKQGL